MATVIAVVNQKGGCSKTSVVANIDYLNTGDGEPQ